MISYCFAVFAQYLWFLLLLLIDNERIPTNILADLLPTYGALPHDGVVLQQLRAHQCQQDIEHAELQRW